LCCRLLLATHFMRTAFFGGKCASCGITETSDGEFSSGETLLVQN
jgi:hypothetical protein